MIRDHGAVPHLVRFYYSAAAKLTMSVLSRFCLNMAANVGLQYAAELLPTPIRTQGVALIHIFGIIAHSVAPYVVDSVSGLSYFSIKKRTILGSSDTTILRDDVVLLKSYFYGGNFSKNV